MQESLAYILILPISKALQISHIIAIEVQFLDSIWALVFVVKLTQLGPMMPMKKAFPFDIFNYATKQDYLFLDNFCRSYCQISQKLKAGENDLYKPTKFLVV